MMEKIMLDSKSYQTIKVMLNSKDPESRNLALISINEVDLYKSKGYVLLLFKDQSHDQKLEWLFYNDYPNIVENFKKWKIDPYTKLTYTQIMRELLKNKNGEN